MCRFVASSELQNDCDCQCKMIVTVNVLMWNTKHGSPFTPLHLPLYMAHGSLFVVLVNDPSILLSLQKNCLMIYNQNSFIFWLKFFYILTDETTVSGQYVEGECSIQITVCWLLFHWWYVVGECSVYLCINMLQTTVCWVLFHWWWFMQLTYWSLSPNGSKCMRSLVPFK